MTVNPDHLLAALSVVGGILGFMVQRIFTLASRIAVLEASQATVASIDAKVDKLCVELAALQATLLERFK